MLLQRYLQTINELNPNKIYVENVRSFFKVPTFVARLMCEMAVVDKLFTKKIGLVCPNSDCNRIIASFSSEKDIPQEIECSICEDEDKEIFSYKTKDLEKIEFYQLKKSDA
jgi:hypothetical protein